MLDIAAIRDDPDGVAAALRTRVDDVDLRSILDLDERRKRIETELGAARGARKAASKQVGEARRRGEDDTAPRAESEALGSRIVELEEDQRRLEADLRARMLELPNLPDPRVPSGGKEANQVVATWGEQPDPGATPKDHVEMATSLGLVDFERGAKLGGSGYWLYTGQGAALEWALIDFFIDRHRRDGYEFLLPPHVLLDACGYATGQFPKFYDEVFHLRADDDERASFLLPTSETAILNVYRDEILPADRLPLRAFAYTPCYRREAGSHRSNERGTIRGHQFNKVELFAFTTPDQAEAALTELIGKVQALVEELGLHHRTSLLASRDASASMRVTYDVEVWLPSIGEYKEVSSASWAGDYQARRANIRYRPESGGRPEHLHTLNASGLATSRILPAILEQCQLPDGSLAVPAPLQRLVGADVLRPPGVTTRWRSVLFTPATRPDRASRLAVVAADVTVLDLEDAVPIGEKESARRGLAAFARAVRAAAPHLVVLARVNPIDSPWWGDDVAAAATSGVDGVVVPKVAGTGDGALVSAAWTASGGRADPVLLAGIETAAGVEESPTVLSSGRWSAGYFGAEDYAADVGGRRSPGGDEVLYARSRVAMAAAIAGVPAVDQIVTAYRDAAAFARDASVARDLGYRGKLCIHPDQVALAHTAFTPTAEELARATGVLAALAAAGGGVASYEGQMVDAPAIRAAEAVMAAAPRP